MNWHNCLSSICVGFVSSAVSNKGRFKTFSVEINGRKVWPGASLNNNSPCILPRNWLLLVLPALVRLLAADKRRHPEKYKWFHISPVCVVPSELGLCLRTHTSDEKQLFWNWTGSRWSGAEVHSERARGRPIYCTDHLKDGGFLCVWA